MIIINLPTDIRHHIKCLQTIRRKYNNHHTEHTLANLEQSQQQLQLKISADYECNLVSESANNNNSPIYKYTRNLTKSASILSTMFHDSSPVTCDNEKANSFNNYFIPFSQRPRVTPFSVIIIPHRHPILSSLRKMSIML